MSTADEMVAMTRRWVEVNSYTANVEGVNRVGAMITEDFGRIRGLSIDTIAGGPTYGDHLIFRTAAAATKPAILLVGHHDTVFPPGHFESAAGQSWREEDGRAIGPGVLDMKGGLSVIRHTLATLADRGALAAIPIVVVIVADEEVGSPHSTPHLQALAKDAACALVFESGRANDMIITRRKGTGAMTIVAHGKAAHAGNNHKDGVNAIRALARFVEAAEAKTDYARGITVNVGRFTGGTSKNTVPERAECELDLRFETIDDAVALVASLREAAERAGATMTARMEVTGGARRLPLERTIASAALRDEYAACARAAGLGDGEAGLLGGGSDANTTGALGVPSIDGLGPRGAGFHTTTEYAELATFAPKAEALLQFLLGRA